MFLGLFGTTLMDCCPANFRFFVSYQRLCQTSRPIMAKKSPACHSLRPTVRGRLKPPVPWGHLCVDCLPHCLNDGSGDVEIVPFGSCPGSLVCGCVLALLVFGWVLSGVRGVWGWGVWAGAWVSVCGCARCAGRWFRWLAGWCSWVESQCLMVCWKSVVIVFFFVHLSLCGSVLMF